MDFEKDRVLDGMRRLLGKITDAAADIGVTLPQRQIVSAAAVPFDCEQVVAYVTTLRTGVPESRGGAGTYPNDDSNVTLYRLSATLVIVRKTATLPTVPASGPAQTPPSPDAYLTNLTSASGDAAVLLSAANRAQTEDDQVGTGAATRSVAFSAPQGGLVASSCTVEVVI